MPPREIDAFLKRPFHAIVGTSHETADPSWAGLVPLRGSVSTSASSPAPQRNIQRDPRISVCVDGGAMT
jgi:hypothetical protein